MVLGTISATTCNFGFFSEKRRKVGGMGIRSSVDEREDGIESGSGERRQAYRPSVIEMASTSSAVTNSSGSAAVTSTGSSNTTVVDRGFSPWVLGTRQAPTGEVDSADLENFKLRPLDYVHAFFSVLVFLTLTFNQSDLVRCLFPEIGAGGKQLLNNLPLGAGFLSSLVFIIFPSSRKGIGYSDATPSSAADRTVVDRIRQGKEEFTV